MTLAYLCPICQQPLALTDKTLRCAANHSFDFAKEGYVNLLPVQFKKSKDPGDNLEMVQARRAFLASDHYGFLQQAIAAHLTELPAGSCVIDLGCGEGFYTHALKAAAPDCQVYGVDISKPAVKYAAKRYPDCHFSVASIAQTPFATGQANALVSVFAPLFDNELARLAHLADAESTQTNGFLLVASPGPWHLKELKEIIYREVEEHTPVPCPLGFKQVSQQVLSKHVLLPSDLACHLIMMTPFAWKFRPEHWDSLRALNEISVKLEFYLTRFERCAQQQESAEVNI
ncbi:putative RNA methyltransferase [Pseudoalteromonas tunicata]|uniref:Putative 23S rRNA m1G745 methyltransferase n=1 Tax=Pseudoalteromonas tunicata D2 TaxID=87626 RepID=A4CBS8_9GAMM|nr:methyltransferase domain-containing protein [Pseudoalteromonas tunicata]ATC94370.1 23S rRNA (guanine745-N1)-methyltransferase [Pseudoalteromonas tunicata]AXT30109.1 methyltransferase domain-containing protein [Pseudoalteromonas tunicata]EAR27815.1 putative 23S rRNA m1G745 methyltransferase [Pseudoalteromonas tunicata D2]MDP4982997.1 methyltransferase domain-containing protein [Pseudoalteromonas tunicata]